MKATSDTLAGDEARAQLSAIDDALDRLKRWWRDPSRKLGEYVTAAQVSAVNAERRHDHAALHVELEALEVERRRLQSAIMEGHAAAAGELAALGEAVERLRQDFAAVMR